MARSAGPYLECRRTTGCSFERIIKPNFSGAQTIGSKRVTAPPEVLQAPDAPPLEGEENGNTTLLTPASPGLPNDWTSTHNYETASVNTPRRAQNATAAQVDDAVSNKDNTTIREFTVGNVDPDSANASQALDTCTICNTVEPK